MSLGSGNKAKHLNISKFRIYSIQIKKVINMAIDDKVNKGRRNFLGLVGKAAAVATLYPIAKTVSGLVPEAKAGGDDYEAMLRTYMSQPVEDTLPDRTVYVNDNTYQAEVMDANQPTMVMFHVTGDTENVGGTQGLAALTRVLADKFPEIKTAAYEINDSNIVTAEEKAELQEKYPMLKSTPALVFYDNDNGKNEYLAQSSGGILDVDFLKKAITNYDKAIPIHMLD